MSSSSSSSSGGIGFLGLLTVLFIGLKLTGYIAWSWFWVLSPIILPTLLVLILAALAGVFVLAMLYFSKRRPPKNFGDIGVKCGRPIGGPSVADLLAAARRKSGL